MRTVLHSDLNNFYASVECSLNPSLKGHPVAVCGNPEMRHGIVLAKNYEAKAYGVQTGEALWEAREKCPNIIFVPPHYDVYMEYSKEARSIYAEYTDQVESFGLDECWLDVTGSRLLFGDGKTIADDIREKIKKRLGVSVSVGVSFNKIFAKLASDMRKPDKTTVIGADDFKEKVWPLPVSDLLYIGRATTARLNLYGIKTIGQLAMADDRLIHSLLGKNGIQLLSFARGEDTAPVKNIAAKTLVKSVSCGNTAPRDLVSDEDVKILIIALATNVSRRLRDYGFDCRCVQLQIRESDLTSFERQIRLPYPCRTSEEIYKAAYSLYLKNARGLRIRSVSVHACDLVYNETEQMSFSPDIEKIQRREKLENAFDSLNERYGAGTVCRGILMTDPEIAYIGLKSTPGILPGRMFGS